MSGGGGRGVRVEGNAGSANNPGGRAKAATHGRPGSKGEWTEVKDLPQQLADEQKVFRLLVKTMVGGGEYMIEAG